VPGGFGTIEAMEDFEYLAEIRRLAERARYVTSVCSGSLLLGAAGLLQGTERLRRSLVRLYGAPPFRMEAQYGGVIWELQ
jgi:hypothetical protein